MPNAGTTYILDRGNSRIKEQDGKLIVEVYRWPPPGVPGCWNEATPEETQQAILYWIADIYARIGEPKG